MSGDGFLGGYYASMHRTRLVSIDGCSPGQVTVGSPAQRREFRAFQQAMQEGFFAMTAAPESGDRKLRDEQVEQLCAIYAGIGYTALNVRVMAERNLLDILPRGHHVGGNTLRGTRVRPLCVRPCR